MNAQVQPKSLKEKMADKKLIKKAKIVQRKFDNLKPEDKEFNWKDVHYASSLVRDLLISNASVLTIAQQLPLEVKQYLPEDFKVRYDTIASDTNKFSATWIEIVKHLKPADQLVELDDINTIYVIYEQLNELQLDIRNATELAVGSLNIDIQEALTQQKLALENKSE